MTVGGAVGDRGGGEVERVPVCLLEQVFLCLFFVQVFSGGRGFWDMKGKHKGLM